ncbi:PREDICTED: TIC 62 [Prunus dulcis]|uniref:PREDICTED: TIC 62 n=1 Tax=Prunus dulcis TaxID=3755 RepID=A0A5E4EJM3_PRUDU|nr:protein TIC 62, chloroplastic isoform X1 [Prunus dulcis]VVA15169.1 PREDICTED: TIC 62 [Prunus dulcis]
MEACSLHSPTVTTIPSLSQSGFTEKPLLRGQVLKFSNSKRYPHARKLGFLHIKAQASGTAKFSSEIVEPTSKEVDLKDENLAFVAGATGKVGSRTVRELLKLGFQVRAGVRNAQRAETLVQSVKQMKLDGEGTQPVEKLKIVECDLEKPDQIGPALGNASVVLCCIGASEKEVFDVTGPYRIDYLATKNLIEAATVAKVNHFILLTSLGTNKIGFPAAILNLFWGVLIWKRKAEEALIASGLPYTIMRPGGMERPTDAYKETHNTTLSKEDTLFGGQVSNLQVAELLASAAKNRAVSYFKVVEVIAETTAPLTPLEDLLAKIPSQRADTYPPKGLGTAPATSPEPSRSAKPPTSPTLSPSTTDIATKASDADARPAAPAATTLQEASETIVEKEDIETKAKDTRSLSPYALYEDFKPPSSPSPSPPSVQKDNVVDAVSLTISDAQTSTVDTTTAVDEIKPTSQEVLITRPLSPYVAYEDLKPPSSPSPIPSGPKQTPLEASTPVEAVSQSSGGNDSTEAVISSVAEEVSPQNSIHYHSPYYVYDNFKPPSSPSPTPPILSSPTPTPAILSVLSEPVANNGSPIDTLNSKVQPPTEDAQSNSEQHTKPKPRPLSPFFMYEELKPPASPIPSPKKS